ncbi:hypothetical protein [Photorhabdus aegyptia]|uniref:Uncharacterized protein n=1 Tax=Photorhabdus aegyptia TaxID=2805098 RepID=A0A022PMK6_9GAMM|nr:hypothetical protein [Photorhabdus aegyptia]EYU17322.1 hypothetical protein BA1DRAFT_00102 [Photorhabdus aegyptia]KGM28556.1 hypothetical protein KS18_08980 [Photorhabdus luminescens]
MKQEVNQRYRTLSGSYHWDRILTNSPKMMTLCCDTVKVGEMPLTLQAKLYRLNAIHLSPLRGRSEDIALLAYSLPYGHSPMSNISYIGNQYEK